MYYIIFDPNTKDASMLMSDNGFIYDFASYNEAKEEAEQWREAGDCKTFRIVGQCTDDRNHII